MSQLLREKIEAVTKLTDAEFEHVLRYFNVKKFRRHQYLIQEGNAVTQEFFINHGLAKAFFIDEDGKEHIVQFAMEGNWITDSEALHQQTGAKLNIDCLEDCAILSITKDNLERLCDDFPKMQLYFRKKSFEDIALLQRRVLCLIKGTAADRFHDLISSNPQLLQRVPKTMIASYLGVSRETLSRMIVQ